MVRMNDLQIELRSLKRQVSVKDTAMKEEMV